MEREYLLLERELDRALEEMGEEGREILQSLYYRMLRLRGECGKTRAGHRGRFHHAGRSPGATVPCVRPKGHKGPHASEWIEVEWGPLHRHVWGSVILEGREVIFLPSLKKYRIDDGGVQRAQFGGWWLYSPTVPYPRFPEERKEEECQSE